MLQPTKKGILAIIAGTFALAVVLTLLSSPLERDDVATSQSGGYALGMFGGGTASDKAAWGEAGMDAAVVSGMPAPMMPTDERGASIGMMPPYEPSAGPTAADADQRIIKNGSIDMVVDHVQDGIAKVAAIASAQKGFVQYSNVNERGDGTFSASIAIRVPAAAFDAAMTEIKGIANVVKSESVSGQDVTEQYTDLEARLRNAKAQEASYLSVLNRASSVEDILAVQRELSTIRYQIESLEGQRQYLENQTSLSTITVSMAEEPGVRIPTKEFRPWAAVKEAAQALVAIVQSMVVWLIWAVIIGIGVLIPFALFWAIVLWAGRALWRKFAASKAPIRRK